MIALVVCLGIMLAVNLFELRKDMNTHNHTYTYELSSMELALRDHDYPRLLSMVKENVCKKATTVYDTTEYDAIARFYEAASYYYLYAESGMEDRADQYASKMKEYQEKLSSTRFIEIADEIKLKFTP